MTAAFHELLTRFGAIAIALLVVIAPVNALPGTSCFVVQAEEEDEQIELLADSRIAAPSRSAHKQRLAIHRVAQFSHRSHQFVMGSLPTQPTPAPFDAARNLRLHC